MSNRVTISSLAPSRNRQFENIVVTDTLVASTISSEGSTGTGDISITGTGVAVNITSTEAATDAIRLNASNAAGGIDLDSGTGGIDMLTTGGFSVDSSSTTTGSNLSNVGAAGVDLTVSSTSGSVIVSGGEAATDAIQLTTAAGGVTVSTAATGSMLIDAARIGETQAVITNAGLTTAVGQSGSNFWIDMTGGAVTVTLSNLSAVPGTKYGFHVLTTTNNALTFVTETATDSMLGNVFYHDTNTANSLDMIAADGAGSTNQLAMTFATTEGQGSWFEFYCANPTGTNPTWLVKGNCEVNGGGAGTAPAFS